ncbi:unnamed protein product [Closterium sp. Yama58-4]|nr:unnamed protein product [Closterium sp. Yama58-4]
MRTGTHMVVLACARTKLTHSLLDFQCILSHMRTGTHMVVLARKADSLCFALDANGEGRITAADVARLAAVHSFLWSEQQVEDMVTLFSQSQGNGMGMLDFRHVLSQCGRL